MTKFDLKKLDFVPAPDGFDQSESLFRCEIADLDNGGQVITGYDEIMEKGIVAFKETEYGQWVDNTNMRDWKKLDDAFGRLSWTSMLAYVEEAAREALEYMHYDDDFEEDFDDFDYDY